MTSGKTSRPQDAEGTSASAEKRKAKPEWADGLRQIYDSVLDEPLPDSFNDLLAKLDDPS
ncbi:NepR family anti-sigma factor [Pontixanthobacter aestiaquae]|uniref:Anti-sigma factor NepR domain-containing protein n=1 Tax=Pontixanthobacter aestiaquae TaxID=1509367 RepID=A0A844Z6V5_9SPHN|nr:NepR family anti-sigma factor [Pontixanthobacter aestiaquae]MDN3646462.1 NepR family anti-sigma factor [Pontixanthobacter aestiaquae]MXO82550.1 hypothetical protein [Pontixanthobacter aestiaquae]